jgi:ribosome production factor 2
MLATATTRKPKSKRAKRALQQREAKVFENPKSMLVMKGRRSSETVTTFLTHMHLLKKPFSKKLTRKNDVLPFEDMSSLEFLCNKNDTSLFVIGSHSKKRPNNIILGRMFNYNLYDMYEFGIEHLVAPTSGKTHLGSKPCIVCEGDAFEHNPILNNVRNLFVDAFRSAELEEIAAEGLNNVIVVSAIGDLIHLRHYSITLGAVATATPKVTLEPTGFYAVLSLRRTHVPSSDMKREALKQPKQAKAVKVKNVEEGLVGNVLGRIHMEKQDLTGLALKKMRGLKRGREEAAAVPSSSSSDVVVASEAEEAEEEAIEVASPAEKVVKSSKKKARRT